MPSLVVLGRILEHPENECDGCHEKASDHHGVCARQMHDLHDGAPNASGSANQERKCNSRLHNQDINSEYQYAKSPRMAYLTGKYLSTKTGYKLVPTPFSAHFASTLSSL